MTLRILRWRSLIGEGLEALTLLPSTEGYEARSVLIPPEGPGLSYTVWLDHGFVFRKLVLEDTAGRSLILLSDGRGLWADGAGRLLPALSGCLDIDISGTPFTNSLPVRRLGLAPGASASLTMALIPLDTLSPVPDGQVYTRLDEAGHYRYQSADGAFSADLEFDADGFIVYYPNLFQRA